MEAFDIIGILLTLAAIFGFVNFMFIKFPSMIGFMFLVLMFSLVIFISGLFIDNFYQFIINNMGMLQ